MTLLRIFKFSKRSRLFRCRPKLLHTCNDITRRFYARGKLDVKGNLRRTEFLGCLDVLGDLLEGAGKVDAVFLNRSVMNLDIGADDSAEGSRPASFAIPLIPSNIGPMPPSGIPTGNQPLASDATRFMAAGV